MYCDGKPDEEIKRVAERATYMNKILREEGLRFDADVYVKELFIKTFQLIRVSKEDRQKELNETIETAKLIETEWKEGEKNEQFREIKELLHVVYVAQNETEESYKLIDNYLEETLKKFKFNESGLMNYAFGLINQVKKKEPKNRLIFKDDNPGKKVEWD